MADAFVPNNDKFLVIAVLGREHSGKSTLLNAFDQDAQLSTTDGKATPSFPIASEDQVLSGQRCTRGINFRITSNRHILLDLQPLLSLSELDELMDIPSDKIPFGLETAEQLLRHRACQLILFAMSVAHVVLVTQRWTPDTELWSLLRMCDHMAAPRPDRYLPAKEPAWQRIAAKLMVMAPTYAKLVMVYNRAPREFFVPGVTERLIDMAELFFHHSYSTLLDCGCTLCPVGPFVVGGNLKPRKQSGIPMLHRQSGIKDFVSGRTGRDMLFVPKMSAARRLDP
ncbi:uncharacterized protein MONBRDRAFT_29842 [Monosiga brevicollis MX1]|uniref:G domain-containing protein n=1 Tax=Monosiga brevicollis TaxID=81824 RepID=A9VCA1_MONBE|nr:uncharacterized protein MONBRDRAFT_29842 [Monosiga brevicollis MX1]EDQ84824.1 predicted protein [Monosiga brevicollis MX1]|eukprot:XP_001750325.1 hypothetical protein [Monosiga brevicollis MX1]